MKETFKDFSYKDVQSNTNVCSTSLTFPRMDMMISSSIRSLVSFRMIIRS